MKEQISLISIEEHAERELEASRATLHINIGGQSFFSGQEAFKKAAELKSLREGLNTLGYDDESLTIRDVQLSGSGGFLTKSSSATYFLELRCDNLENLGSALAQVAAQKNCNLGHIEWGYGDIDVIKRELVAEAAKHARTLAENIAQASGVRVKSLHRFRYGTPVVHAPDLAMGGAGGPPLRSSMMRLDEERAMDSLSLSNTMSVRVDVSVEYEVDAETAT